LPECRLYDQLFDVTRSAAEFIAAIQSSIQAGSLDPRAVQRLACARSNSCDRVVERLLNWLPLP
jgi:hypothetical protein